LASGSERGNSVLRGSHAPQNVLNSIATLLPSTQPLSLNSFVVGQPLEGDLAGLIGPVIP